MKHRRNHARGFSLLELLLAMAITIIVMAAALTMYRKSMDAVIVVSQRTEMQANARSGINNIVRDLSQAGSSGVPWGGISLPNCAASPCGLPVPLFATDSTATSYLTADTFAQRQLYMVTPSFTGGPTINVGRATASDGIAVLYVDQQLNTSNNPGGWTNTPATSISANGDIVTMPAGMVPPVNDPVSGINKGDLMMLSNNNGVAVGVVTSANKTNPLGFADGDPLNINQNTANSGNIKSLATAGVYPATTLQRLYLVSYFIQPLDANGNLLPLNTNAAVDGRLMRQVNTSAPVPVAEHIIALNFAYDLSDATTGVATADVPDATVAGVAAYNEIRNIYVSVTARSARPDRNRQYSYSTLYTNVSPRNLVFRDTFN